MEDIPYPDLNGSSHLKGCDEDPCAGQADPDPQPDWPELTMPEAESEALRQAYKASSVILEYGTGGSTMVGCSRPGKLIFGVESDRMWALRMQAHIDKTNPPSPATIYYVDIGATGDWGRPIDDSGSSRFHRYPTAIWNEPFFRHPDVILIDGRFRPGCFIAALMCIKRPTRVLFDDYVTRSEYSIIEAYAQPSSLIGRMAVFDLVPNTLPVTAMAEIVPILTRASYAKGVRSSASK